MNKPDWMCQYFALCENPAEGLVVIPALGEIPSCERCAKRMEQDFIPYHRELDSYERMIRAL